MREKFKDVTVGDEQFRVGVVPADRGNWAVMMLAGGKSEDPEIFQKIQDLLLANIQVYRGSGEVSVPVKMYDPSRRNENGDPDPWQDAEDDDAEEADDGQPEL